MSEFFHSTQFLRQTMKSNAPNQNENIYRLQQQSTANQNETRQR
jgi:hypothetical protein